MKKLLTVLLVIALLAGICPNAYAEENAPVFSDVSAGSWYYSSTCYVASRGIMGGVGGGRFDPKGTASRAMLATVIYRLAGSPEAKGPAPFTDVKDGSWYSTAVAWAAENGIINGIGNGKFAPDDPVTREQTVTILYRYLGKGEDVTEQLTPYADTLAVASWSLDAIRWAVQSEILSGKLEGTTLLLDPQSQIIRAELAAVLMRTLMQRDPEHVHAYTSDTIIEPTCTEKGYTRHSCLCGASICDTYTDSLGREHEFSDWFHRATPTSSGYTEHRCFYCSYAYRDNYVAAYNAAKASTVQGREELARAEAQRMAAIIIKPGMTETEKAIALGTWLHENAGLQTNQSNEAYKTNFGNEAFAVFFFRCAACSGFCKAMTMLCDIVGLKSQHINQNQWTHQWNKVYCDGKWIIIDAQGGLFGGEHHLLEDGFDEIYAPQIAVEAENRLNNYLKSLGYTGEPAGTMLDEGKCVSWGQYTSISADDLFTQCKETLDHWLYDLDFINWRDSSGVTPSAVRVKFDGLCFTMTWFID